MSGKASGTTARPWASAMARTQSSSEDLPRPMTGTSRVRPQMLMPSMLTFAASRPGGTGEWRARYEEPSSPCSSAATAAKRIERRGRSGSATNASAIASIVASPEALSRAPLYTTGSPVGPGFVPRWSWCAL